MGLRTLKRTFGGDNTPPGESAGTPPHRPGSEISVVCAPAREASPHDIARERVVVALAASALSLCACQSPPPVSYAWDVSPILEQKCVPCHTPPDGEGYRLSGLDMSGEGRIHPLVGTTRQTNPLSDPETEILELWVDQGARNN